MTTHTTKRQRLSEEHSDSLLDGSRPIQLQRRRVWRACEECRRKKIKCDSREPICSQCSQSNAVCKWAQTKDRAALSRHYVQELEARLLYMEQLFKKHAPDVEVFPEGSGLPIQMAKNIPLLLSFPSASRPEIDPQEDEVSALTTVKQEEDSSLSEHFGQMALDADGHLRWIGGSATMTLIEKFRNEMTNPDAGASPSSDQSSQPTINNLYFPTSLGFGKLQALPYANEVEYPERDLADMLVAAYFERFHFLLPVLDKPSFLERYQRLMDNGGMNEQPGFVSVVFAVFACAARFLDDQRIKSEDPTDKRGTPTIYYERSMMLYYIDHTATQLAHVQCFVLLSSFLASLNRLPQAWLLVGQAVRIAQDLGLHRSPKLLALSNVEKETRRKVWWCVYGLDRILALQLGRPLGIEDVDVDLDLPLPYDDVDLPSYYNDTLVLPEGPTLMSGFIALTSLYRITGRVLRHVFATDKLKGNISSAKAEELFQVVTKLDAQLARWCDELHPHLRTVPPTPQMAVLSSVLCSTYYTILVTLHRNFLPSRRKGQQYTEYNSVPKAIAASRSSIYLATSSIPLIPPSHHLAVFVQGLFSSAIIVLLVVMHATDKTAADTAMEEVASSIRCLGDLEPLWPGAGKCKELLSELNDITIDNLRKTGRSARKKYTSPNSPTKDSHTRSHGNNPSISSLGEYQQLTPPNFYSNNGSVQSTPSPPMPHMSPVKRRREDTIVPSHPLTLNDTSISKSNGNTQPTTTTDFDSDLFEQRFAPFFSNGYDTQMWSRLTAPTYLDDPSFYQNRAEEASNAYAAHLYPLSQPVFNNMGQQVASHNAGVGNNAGVTPFDMPGLPPFSGMDIIRGFGSTAPLQGDPVWDGLPDIFGSEPLGFGVTGDFQNN